MEFSSVVDASLARAIEKHDTALRGTRDYGGLDASVQRQADKVFKEGHAVAARLEAKSQEIARRVKVEQEVVGGSPEVLAESRARAKNDLFDETERAASELDRIQSAYATAKAAHEKRSDGISRGWLQPDGTVKEPTNDRSHFRFDRRALRELPESVREEQYLNAVMQGGPSDLVDAIDSGPKSLGLVSDRTRERAKQIRLSMSPAANSLTQQETALGLMDMAIGNTSRAIAEHIAKLKI